MERKRQQELEQLLPKQSWIDKEMEHSVDKGSKRILYTIKQTFTVGTMPKKKRSKKKRKTIVPIERVSGEENQTTAVSNV